MRFNQFPNELKFKIFSNLTPNELCSVVAPVCAEWKKWAYEPALWTTLDIDGNALSTRNMAEILSRGYCANRVTMRYVHDFSWASNILIRKRVTELKLKGCCLTDDDVQRVIALFPYTTKFYCSILNFGIESIQHLARWKYLKNVHLIGIAENEDYEKQWLNSLAKHCSNHLVTFYFVGNNFIDDRSFALFLKLRGEKLKSLTVRCVAMTGAIYKSLIILCPFLMELKVCDALSMTDSDFVALKELQFLQLIHIEDGENLFSGNFRRTYKDVIFPKVTLLLLATIPTLNDDSLPVILECFPLLRELDLFLFNTITDAGLQTVPLCTNLECLWLGRMPNVTINCLHYITEKLPQLLHIHAGKCPLIRFGRSCTYYGIKGQGVKCQICRRGDVTI